MSVGESLFAQKLKAHRLQLGKHGRMTQDQLAEALGVSVDAVGKYERSLSFIRGDLERRLVERLGWSQDAVLACREDWEGRDGRATRYQVIDDAAVAAYFGGSLERVSAAAIALCEEQVPDLPEELAADNGVFEKMNIRYRESWAGVLFEGRMVAKWVVFPMLSEVEADFLAGGLMESDLMLESVRQTLLPGSCFGYSPALIVVPGHERAASLLISTFVAYLEALAQRGIVFHGIGTISCSAPGAQVCRDLGMKHLGEHVLGPRYQNWLLDGAGLARSIFARKSAIVRESYGRAFL